MTIDLAVGTKLRRDFKLPEEDVDCLDALRLRWQTLAAEGAKWLLISHYSIPAGYDHETADVALRIPPSYPDDQVDMVYFSPPLALKNGKAIRQLSLMAIDGKSYQQWSRHRTAANPWRPGLDNIGTHLLQVDDWLRRELS